MSCTVVCGDANLDQRVELDPFNVALRETQMWITNAHYAALATVEAELQHMRHENVRLRTQLAESAAEVAALSQKVASAPVSSPPSASALPTSPLTPASEAPGSLLHTVQSQQGSMWAALSTSSAPATAPATQSLEMTLPVETAGFDQPAPRSAASVEVRFPEAPHLAAPSAVGQAATAAALAGLQQDRVSAVNQSQESMPSTSVAASSDAHQANVTLVRDRVDLDEIVGVRFGSPKGAASTDDIAEGSRRVGQIPSSSQTFGSAGRALSAPRTAFAAHGSTIASAPPSRQLLPSRTPEPSPGRRVRQVSRGPQNVQERSPSVSKPAKVQDVGKALEAVLAHYGWQHLAVQRKANDVWTVSGINFQLRFDSSPQARPIPTGSLPGPPFRLAASDDSGRTWEALEGWIRRRRLHKVVRTAPIATGTVEYSVEQPAGNVTAPLRVLHGSTSPSRSAGRSGREGSAQPMSLADLANLSATSRRQGGDMPQQHVQAGGFNDTEALAAVGATTMPASATVPAPSFHAATVLVEGVAKQFRVV